MTCDTSLQGIDNNNEWGQYEKKTISNTVARRRTLLKVRHRRILNRQKLFFTFIQSQD